MKHLPKISIALVTGCLLVPTTYAQDTDGAALEEITVTAQRREQTTFEVPISISSFSGAQLEQGNYKGARDFLQLTPNVAFTSNDQQGNKNGDISIRGLGDLTGGGNERLIQSRPTIGYFVDDFSTAFVASGSANPPLDDVERVEILRGPQGTYFGRNATGGALNIVTKKPNENGMAKVRLGIGNHDSYDVGLVGNVPVTENLFVRGSASFTSSGGHLENIHPTGNQPGYESLNARIALRWVHDDWTVDLASHFIDEDDEQMARIPTMSGPAGFLFTASGGATAAGATCGLGQNIYIENGNEDKMCEDQAAFTDIDNSLTTMRIEHLGDRFGLTSITGFIKSDMYQYEDVENSGLDFFNRVSDYSSESFSQEIRVFSTESTKIGSIGFDWMIGAITYDDEAQVNNMIISGADVILSGAFPGGGPLGATTPGDRPNENEIAINRDGFAAFFDLGFDLTDSLTLQVGGRFSSDDDSQSWANTYASFGCGRRQVIAGVPDPFTANCALRPDQDVVIYTAPDGSQFTSGGRFDQTANNPFLNVANDGTNFSPRVALNWALSDDASAYATISTGYRAPGGRSAPDGGGPGDTITDGRSRFDEETVTNFEIGYKAFLMDRRVKLEAAVFRMDWDDMQVRVSRTLCQPGLEVVPSPADCPAGGTGFSPLNLVANADSARSQGLEVTGQFLVTDSFVIEGAIGLMDAEFKSFTDAPQGDVSGQQLPNAPDTTAFLAGQYEWGGEVSKFVRLEASYRSDVVSRFGDIPATAFPQISPSSTIVNFRAGVEWENQSLIFNVANLGDEDYYSGLDSFSHSGSVTTPGGTFVNLAWTMTADF
ncbi:MAG: TonB-dependent receptor [Gammaproteobacteria bacterium]|nr:TonB-dependent receptor [Gammaproteobacteria bacterium]